MTTKSDSSWPGQSRESTALDRLLPSLSGVQQIRMEGTKHCALPTKTGIRVFLSQWVRASYWSTVMPVVKQEMWWKP